jgi:hypothetical protein
MEVKFIPLTLSPSPLVSSNCFAIQSGGIINCMPNAVLTEFQSERFCGSSDDVKDAVKLLIELIGSDWADEDNEDGGTFVALLSSDLDSR